ncbi:MAG: hypothetical protein HZA54_18860 [Planctomycetes bacterium]|nr:hypothetical protein [Planctomycetota bacterium]
MICRDHESTSGPDLPYARPAGSAGPRADAAPPPPGAVARTAARDLENAYISRVQQTVLTTPALHHPLEGRFYDNLRATRTFSVLDAGAEEVRRTLREIPELPAHRTFKEMPLDKAFVCEVSTVAGFFGGRVPKVGAVALALSPLDELARRGHATRPLAGADVRAAVARLGLRAEVFYFVAALSTTGWSPESRPPALGGPNWVGGLATRTPWGWRFESGAEPRWAEGRRLFLLETPEEEVAAVRRYVADRACELLMGRLTVERAAAELGLAAAVVDRGFAQAAAADRFLRVVREGEGARLERVY